MSDLCQMTLTVPDRRAGAEAFERLGFELDRGASLVQLGSVQLELSEQAEPPHGLTEWSFVGPDAGKVRLDPSVAPPTFLQTSKPPAYMTSHPNGTNGIDHVVLMVPALEPLVAGLEGFVGVQLRRRTQIRGLPAAFMRAGEAVLEVIEVRSSERPRLWGIAVEVEDLDSTIESIRARDGAVTGAGQATQGGRIASSPPEACFGVSIAYMEKPPPKMQAKS